MKPPGARLAALFTQPRQIMIMNTLGTGRPRHLHVRPVTLIGVSLFLLGLATYGGYLIFSLDYFHSADEASRIQLAQSIQLQRYESQLAEVNSELAIKQSRLKSLQNEVRGQSGRIEQLGLRLQMLESILAAQKTAGIHILKAEASWQDRKTLAYSLVLVKGGSYPRRATGSLRLTARGPDGQELVLWLGEKQTELPYHMETHTFLHGKLEWTSDWLPDKILVSRLDRKGTIREEIEIPITGGIT